MDRRTGGDPPFLFFDFQRGFTRIAYAKFHGILIASIF